MLNHDVSPGSLSCLPWGIALPKNPSPPRFGVFQGDSLNFLARGLHDVTLYGFDSFWGLPAAPGSTEKKGPTWETNGNQ